MPRCMIRTEIPVDDELGRITRLYRVFGTGWQLPPRARLADELLAVDPGFSANLASGPVELIEDQLAEESRAKTERLRQRRAQ